ncbi:MAG TPA: hypothetical protein PK264_19170 [Hyphomicrobiaceae bacterium]|nr:hypothetical protein [Hyphomicrobiaceae bacterium]
MLPRIILLLVQLAAGWSLAPHIVRFLPKLGSLDIFVVAAVFAILVVMIGFIGSLVLKEVGPPSSQTMTTVLVVALVFAALTLVPQVVSAVSSVTKGQVPKLAYPLIGAVLGYFARR